MPAVITYWQLQEDEEDFLDYLTTTGDVVAMPDGWVKTKEELAPRPVTAFVRETHHFQFVIALESHAMAAEIEPQEKDGETFLSLAYMSPSVIMCRPGRIRDGNKLGQSNLAAYWTYFDKGSGAIRTKDQKFVRWARNVFGWVRRRTSERILFNKFAYRATPRAKRAADAGDIEPVL